MGALSKSSNKGSVSIRSQRVVNCMKLSDVKPVHAGVT